MQLAMWTSNPMNRSILEPSGCVFFTTGRVRGSMLGRQPPGSAPDGAEQTRCPMMLMIDSQPAGRDLVLEPLSRVFQAGRGELLPGRRAALELKVHYAPSFNRWNLGRSRAWGLPADGTFGSLKYDYSSGSANAIMASPAAKPALS